MLGKVLRFARSGKRLWCVNEKAATRVSGYRERVPEAALEQC
jgi:hypothetical protein